MGLSLSEKKKKNSMGAAKKELHFNSREEWKNVILLQECYHIKKIKQTKKNATSFFFR